jgi:hypothetical protein
VTHPALSIISQTLALKCRIPVNQQCAKRRTNESSFAEQSEKNAGKVVTMRLASLHILIVLQVRRSQWISHVARLMFLETLDCGTPGTIQGALGHHPETMQHMLLAQLYQHVMSIVHCMASQKQTPPHLGYQCQKGLQSSLSELHGRVMASSLQARVTEHRWRILPVSIPTILEPKKQSG